MLTRRLFVLSALLAAGGCALDKQNPPSFMGPSEFGLSVNVTATPDVVSWDGTSQALIEVVALDANSQPARGVSMRVETAVPNADGSVTVADVGSLTARTISTNNDGRAAVTFISPPAPPPTAGSDAIVMILVTPIGSNYQNANTKSVAVRLARPGIILPPNGQPVAAFFFSPQQPREGDTLQFDGSASLDDGQIVNYHWTFGDGETGEGVRVTHTYERAGQYAVVLTVTDDRGMTDSTDPVQVVVAASGAPEPSFSISPTDPVAGQAVNVNGTLSRAAPGRTIVRYEWDFGDGSAIVRGQTASHVYALPGSYVITLRVTDDLGKVAAAAQDVTVKGSGPTASFTVTPASPHVFEVATFNASGSSALQGRTITSYQWDFGDGTTGSNVTTTHAYAATGTYTVTLLLTDSAGQTGSISRTITIIP